MCTSELQGLARLKQELLEFENQKREELTRFEEYKKEEIKKLKLVVNIHMRVRVCFFVPCIKHFVSRKEKKTLNKF